MKVVIVGAGEVGSYLSAELSLLGHSVTVIEEDDSKAARLDEEHNVRVINGNGSSSETLLQAKAGECDTFLAMTSDDRTNLVASSLAKVLGAKQTVARIHDQTYTDTSIVNYQLHFGIDQLLNPEGLCAVELAKAIRNAGRVAVENFARGQIEVQQVRVSTRSKLVGRALRDVRLSGGVSVGFFGRGDEYGVGTGDTVLEPDDLVTLFGPPEALTESRRKFDPAAAAETVRVVLYGGTETAIALVRLLTNPRFKIRIVDPNLSLCRRLAEKFPHVTVIQGDATQLRVLEEEQVGDADYFVACTKDDEDNIVTALQASKLGASHVQLVINKTDYDDVIDNLKGALGVELVVSPRLATAAEVVRFLSTDTVQQLAILPDGSAKIVEMVVSLDSPCAGRLVKEVPWPRGARLVALLHKFQAKVPGGDDKILGNDRVVLIASDNALPEVRRMLVG